MHEKGNADKLVDRAVDHSRQLALKFFYFLLLKLQINGFPLLNKAVTQKYGLHLPIFIFKTKII